jgi:hypothetical protein
LARIILSHALLESIRFVMSRKECRDIYGLINSNPRRSKRMVLSRSMGNSMPRVTT